MGMSWCRLGDLFEESRIGALCYVGRFAAGDVCQLGYGFILVWIRDFIMLFLGNEIQDRVENDASLI